MEKNKLSFRSDLAVESIEQIKENDIFKHVHKTYKGIRIDEVKIIQKHESLDKDVGDYISIEFDSIDTEEIREDLINVLETNLRILLDPLKLSNSSRILVVGLGNRDVTADALGPLVSADIKVTSHLFELAPEYVVSGERSISVISPGVMGQTGIETSRFIKALVDNEKPDVVVVVDALASRRLNRVNKTIQLTNTGISPGSGVGNNRLPVNQEELNVPVIAIGVPTVVDISSITYDAINLIESYFATSLNNPSSRLQFGNKKMYEGTLDDENKKKVLGEIGLLKSHEKRSLINEILQPVGLNMIVTVKQIDEEVFQLANIISHSINNALRYQ